MSEKQLAGAVLFGPGELFLRHKLRRDDEEPVGGVLVRPFRRLDVLSSENVVGLEPPPQRRRPDQEHDEPQAGGPDPPRRRRASPHRAPFRLPPAPGSTSSGRCRKAPAPPRLTRHVLCVLVRNAGRIAVPPSRRWSPKSTLARTNERNTGTTATGP